MNRSKTTQTSPELMRKYYASLEFETVNEPADQEPEHIRTKTLAVIQTLNDFDENRNKIREIFTIRNKSKSGDGVKYIQVSEYKTDFGSDEPVVKVHESVVLTKDDDRLINNNRLGHSTVELTQVTNNTTTVAEYPYDEDITTFPSRYESSTKIRSKR